jgi:hypothetical protein
MAGLGLFVLRRGKVACLSYIVTGRISDEVLQPSQCARAGMEPSCQIIPWLFSARVRHRG